MMTTVFLRQRVGGIGQLRLPERLNTQTVGRNAASDQALLHRARSPGGQQDVVEFVAFGIGIAHREHHHRIDVAEQPGREIQLTIRVGRELVAALREGDLHLVLNNRADFLPTVGLLASGGGAGCASAV
jgi:hypothetical protein